MVGWEEKKKKMKEEIFWDLDVFSFPESGFLLKVDEDVREEDDEG